MSAALLAGTSASALASTEPAYNLDGTWATSVYCSRNPLHVTTTITAWDSRTGTFSYAIVGENEITVEEKPVKVKENQHGTGTEEGASVTVGDFQGFERYFTKPETLHGVVTREGSSLVLRLKYSCKGSFNEEFAGEYKFVNEHPEAAPGKTESPCAAAAAFSGLEPACTMPSGSGNGGGAGIQQEETLRTQLQAEEQRLSEARQEIARRLRSTAVQESLENSPGVELKFDVLMPGTLETGISVETSSGVASAYAKAKHPLTLARLTKTFKSTGKVKLRVPLTSAGRAFATKLDTAIRRYRRRHPHGHKPPSAGFKVTLHFKPSA